MDQDVEGQCFVRLFDLFPMLSEDNLEQLEEEMDDLMHGEELSADDLASACLLRGSALKHLQRFEEAVVVFEKAIAIKHRVSEYWYALPMVYAEAGHVQEGLIRAQLSGIALISPSELNIT